MRGRTLLACAAVAAVVALAAVGPLLVAPDATTAPVAAPFTADRGLLGTDVLGRDVLARLLEGGRTVLVLAVAATGLATLLGSAVGMALGLAGPRVSDGVVRVVDLVLVFPPLLVLLVLAAGFPGSDAAVLVAVALTTAPTSVRVVRAATRTVAATGYVAVARTRGDRFGAVVVRDVLPGIAGVVLAESGLRFVAAVYLTATAGFLGLGAAAPAPNWGAMVAENLPGASLSPAAVVAPAALLVVFAVAVNLLADDLAERVRGAAPRPAEGLR